jgi:DNA-binding NarL/FixJ family response regulator
MFDLRHRQDIRILMIEEEGLVRAALVTLITSWEGFHVVGEAATKVEALEQFRRLDPDIVLLSLAGTEDVFLERASLARYEKQETTQDTQSTKRP